MPVLLEAQICLDLRKDIAVPCITFAGCSGLKHIIDLSRCKDCDQLGHLKRLTLPEGKARLLAVSLLLRHKQGSPDNNPTLWHAGVAKVVKLGPGVKKLKEGQRVVGIPWPALVGTWQEYRAVPEDTLVSEATSSPNRSKLCLAVCIDLCAVMQLAVPDKMADDVASQFWVSLHHAR